MKKRCVFAPLRSVKKRLRHSTKRKGAKARRRKEIIVHTKKNVFCENRLTFFTPQVMDTLRSRR